MCLFLSSSWIAAGWDSLAVSALATLSWLPIGQADVIMNTKVDFLMAASSRGNVVPVGDRPRRTGDVCKEAAVIPGEPADSPYTCGALDSHCEGTPRESSSFTRVRRVRSKEEGLRAS